MILILIGPPGSGKGTQAKMLMRKYNIPQISTGDILRAEIAKGNALGKKVKKIMDAGNLVSDDIVIDIIENRIEEKDCKNGFIFDGFPRTIAQADGLKELLAKKTLRLDKVLNVAINDKEVVKRISGRWTCKGCEEIFNSYTKPEKEKGKCDKCGGELYQRDDQKEEVVKDRLKVYRNQTEPLINYYKNSEDYKNSDVFADIDGMPSIGVVFKAIIKILKY